jgi:hypothetical protein
MIVAVCMLQLLHCCVCMCDLFGREGMLAYHERFGWQFCSVD